MLMVYDIRQLFQTFPHLKKKNGKKINFGFHYFIVVGKDEIVVNVKIDFANSLAEISYAKKEILFMKCHFLIIL